MLSELLPESAEYWLHQYWDENCDPRTAHLWLMSGGPWKLLAISLAYCLTVFGGTWLMRRREKPFAIRLPMLLYNFALIAINAYFLYQSFWWLDYGRALLSFTFPSPTDRSPRAMGVTRLYQHYLWTKFIDYFDTVFFILRKKNSQITALHFYHHLSVPMVGWMSNWISPTMPVLGLFAMLNCFAHCIMYFYYAVSAFGPSVQPYLWWKRYITQIQLLQFAIIGLYGLAIQLFHSGYPLAYRVMPISQAIIYLVLFGNFYLRSYKSNKDNRKEAPPVKED